VVVAAAKPPMRDHPWNPPVYGDNKPFKLDDVEEKLTNLATSPGAS